MSLVLGLIAARPPTIILHPRKTRAGRANLPRTNAARVSDAFHLCLCGPRRIFKRVVSMDGILRAWRAISWLLVRLLSDRSALGLRIPGPPRSCLFGGGWCAEADAGCPGSWGALPPSQYESRYRRRIFTRLSRFFMQPSDTPHTPKLSTGFKH